MKKRTLKYFAAASALLGLLSSAPSTLAQGKRRIFGRTPASHTSLAKPFGQVPPPGSTSYTFNYVVYPGAEYMFTDGMNLGAATSKMEIVGSAGSTTELVENGWGSGYRLEFAQKKGKTSENFETVNLPKVSLQVAADVNDSGAIVGDYIDSAGNVQGYMFSGSTFSKIQVPFSGATSTLPQGINNSGEVIGGWEEDSNAVEHGFTLIEGAYTSFDFPSAANTVGISVNNNGDIVGFFFDSAGNAHGFLLSDGTYTQIDVPGAVGTFAYGINDGGDIVGEYCTTSACVDSGTNANGAQGFLLSDSVFTTINAPIATTTYLGDINNDGVIVGGCIDGSGNTFGFIAYP